MQGEKKKAFFTKENYALVDAVYQAILGLKASLDEEKFKTLITLIAELRSNFNHFYARYGEGHFIDVKDPVLFPGEGPGSIRVGKKKVKK